MALRGFVPLEIACRVYIVNDFFQGQIFENLNSYKEVLTKNLKKFISFRFFIKKVKINSILMPRHDN